MNRPSLPRAARRMLRAPATGLLALLLAATACAQGGSQPAAGGRARTAAAATAERDSILPRASRARTKGAENAPVTLVEVSDFQCPFCREWAVNTFPKIDSAYIRTGKVKMVFITFPLPNHTEAWAATEGALCAGAQGQFWPMHDRLFATQREWGGQEDAARRIALMAGELRLDMNAYRACTDNDLMAPLVVNDVMQASGAGIGGTPAFIINGQRALSGAIPFEDMAREIDNALAAAAAVQGATQQPQTPPAPPAN